MRRIWLSKWLIAINGPWNGGRVALKRRVLTAHFILTAGASSCREALSFRSFHRVITSVHVPVQTELTLISQIDHPFIVNLRYAFQDDENCFFVLDLMLGGDLRCAYRPAWTIDAYTHLPAVHLERLRYIPETIVRFWMAELSSALEYLHRQRIIHRYAPSERPCGSGASV